jgi:hypothetical protein
MATIVKRQFFCHEAIVKQWRNSSFQEIAERLLSNGRAVVETTWNLAPLCHSRTPLNGNDSGFEPQRCKFSSDECREFPA